MYSVTKCLLILAKDEAQETSTEHLRVEVRVGEK